MGTRLFWFAVGVGVTAFVVVKGREYVRRLTPEGVREQFVETGATARTWVADVVDTFRDARAEREAELRETLGFPGEVRTA